ncbi:MAG: hypothetical protein ACOY5F_04785 [Pseudomonadota bacterium]
MSKKPKRLIRSAALKKRYGDVSDMWIWRRLHDGSGFPQPYRFGRIRMWDEDELDAFDRQCAGGREAA